MKMLFRHIVKFTTMLLQKSELSQKDTKPSMHTCKIEV